MSILRAAYSLRLSRHACVGEEVRAYHKIVTDVELWGVPKATAINGDHRKYPGSGLRTPRALHLLKKQPGLHPLYCTVRVRGTDWLIDPDVAVTVKL